MNLLQMGQLLYQEVGAAGAYPTTVVGATGQWQRLVNWLISSEFYIQNLYVNWKWLRQTYPTTTVPTVNTDPGPTTPAVGEWDYDSWFLTYPGSTTPSPLKAVEWEDVKGEIVDPNDTGVPWRVVIMPDNTLRFDGIPNGAYPVTGVYYQTPTVMPFADASVSPIPSRFHWTIVAQAMIRYANYEGAEGILAQGTGQYTDYLARLENSQIPNKKNARFRANAHFAVGDEGDGGGHYDNRRGWC
jgi:hypothetical protein